MTCGQRSSEFLMHFNTVLCEYHVRQVSAIVEPLKEGADVALSYIR